MSDSQIEMFEAPKLRRGIFLLPNIFTTGGLFAGFYAVVAAMKGMFDVAAAAILIAMVADGLDGRVARLTNTQSYFGAQYDSLSDLVGFGLAPALVAYQWSLIHLGKIGWLVAFCFTATTALRLARFNAQQGQKGKRYFYGLPSPAGAAIIASLIGLCEDHQIVGAHIAWPVAAIALFVSFLMVSNIRYFSFKEADFKHKVPFVSIFLVVFLFMLLSMDPHLMLFAIVYGYALSGPIFGLFRMFRRRKPSHVSES